MARGDQSHFGRIIDILKVGGEMAGADIGHKVGLGSVHLFSTLRAMEHSGVIGSRWKDDDFPRQRLFRLKGWKE